MKKSEQELEFIAMRSELENKIKRLSQNPPPSKNQHAILGRDGPRNDGKFVWKAVAPKAGEPHEKSFDNKEYVYCRHHGDTKCALKVNRRGFNHLESCNKAQKKPEVTAAKTEEQKPRYSYATALTNAMELDSETSNEQLPISP